MKKLLALLLSIMLICCVFTGCGAKETVVVGYTIYEPMNYLDESGKLVGFDTELAEEFLQALVRNLNCTLHVRQLSGSNSHHIIEGIFKSLARSLKQAVAIDPSAKDEIPSTKGVL